MRSVLTLILILALISAAYLASAFIEFPYNINTRGLVSPVKEWRLERMPDGTILNIEHNNILNKTINYSVLEFQRGDNAGFVINDDILSETRLKQGDTIGQIKSYEEERRLLTLESLLYEQIAELNVALSGKKEEEINAAKETLNLSKKEYETQKRLIDRMENLHKNEVISDEDWDIALNEYFIKRQNVIIAQSELEIVSSGAKPEELDLIRTNINSYQKQIKQAKERIAAFTVVAPFCGTIIRERKPESGNNTIINLADKSLMIISLPVDANQFRYLNNGNQVTLKINSLRHPYKAQIIAKDNTVQYLDQRQTIFVTALVEDKSNLLFPNMLVEARINCGTITLRNYLKRLFRVIFAN